VSIAIEDAIPERKSTGRKILGRPRPAEFIMFGYPSKLMKKLICFVGYSFNIIGPQWLGMICKIANFEMLQNLKHFVNLKS
jgi:hypothetical protein